MKYLVSALTISITLFCISASAESRDKKFATADLVEKLSKTVSVTDMVDIEKFLIEGADPNALDKSGNPIIFSVLEPDEIPALQLLGKYKANFDVRNKAGRTPLIDVAYSVATRPNQYLPVWKFLLSQKVDLNAVDNRDVSALHLVTANSKSSLEPLELLLKAGANPNVAMKPAVLALTPLMGAAQVGRDPVIKLLVKYKADVNLKTPRGATALDLARSAKQRSTVDLLISLGGTEGGIDSPSERMPSEVVK